MAPRQENSGAASAPAGGPPGSAVRSVLSLLLLIHLFALGVGVGANYQPVSRLRASLGARLIFLRWYLQALNMDLAYNFHLTYGELEDVDHALAAELAPAKGKAEPTRIELPSPTLKPGIRRRRYQMLAKQIADLAEDDARGGLLPKTIAARLLRETGAEQLTLRSTAHLLLARPEENADVPGLEAANAPSMYRLRYAARVWRDGNEYQLYKMEEQSDTAPVAE